MNVEDSVAVFTARSPERIVREGGSQAWVLSAPRARRLKWLFCTQNKHHPDEKWEDATEPHGSGFLVGRISSVEPARDRADRWIICISTYAKVSIPDAWKGWRNPVRYGSLADFGIDVSTLNFLPVTGECSTQHERVPSARAKELTIAEAKAGLAAKFGISPDSIDIVIRG